MFDGGKLGAVLDGLDGEKVGVTVSTVLGRRDCVGFVDGKKEGACVIQ